MARLYLDFDTNLEKISEDCIGPVVDYITFESGSDYFSLSCNYESDSELSGGHFSARWKGVDCIYDNSEREIDDVEHGLTLDEIESHIVNSKISNIGIYKNDNCKECETPEIKNVKVEICFGDKTYTIEQQAVDPDVYNE